MTSTRIHTPTNVEQRRDYTRPMNVNLVAYRYARSFMQPGLGRIAGEGLFQRGNLGFAVAYIEDQRFFAFCLELPIGLSKRLRRLEGHFRASLIRGQRDGRIRTSEVVGAGKGETHGESFPVFFPR